MLQGSVVSNPTFSHSLYLGAFVPICVLARLCKDTTGPALHLCTWGSRFELGEPETNRAGCKMLTQLLALNTWLNSEQPPKTVQQPALCRHTLSLRFQVRKFKHRTKGRKTRNWKATVQSISNMSFAKKQENQCVHLTSVSLIELLHCSFPDLRRCLQVVA